MAAPFDNAVVSDRAERLASDLRKMDMYADDTWEDAVLGPLVRVYALLTHRPNDAFDGPVSPEYVAECRTYAYVLFATIYDSLARAATADDGYFDLLSEYDSLVDADLEAAKESAVSDARWRLAQLNKSGK